MNLDLLWERVFSEDAEMVRLAWRSLTAEEREPVRTLLAGIVEDSERIEEQRAAARFALRVIDGDTAPERAPGRAPAQAPEMSAVDSRETWVVEGAGNTPYPVPPQALEFARRLAHETGAHLKTASGLLNASLKKDGTLVTVSDIEADQKLGDAILARYPDHGVLSEEGEKIYHGHEWTWVVDPIDGTSNFNWGLPAWGVLIGLLHNGRPVLGVADFPPIDEQLYAVRGGGGWRAGNGTHGDVRLRVATDQKLHKNQLFAVGTRSLKQGRPDIPPKLRLFGSTGFDFAVLAMGACVGALDVTVHVWDVAALWPIIEEAGGTVVTDHPGALFPLRPGTDYSEVVFSALGAASPALLSESLARLSDRFSLSAS